MGNAGLHPEIDLMDLGECLVSTIQIFNESDDMFVPLIILSRTHYAILHVGFALYLQSNVNSFFVKMSSMD